MIIDDTRLKQGPVAQCDRGLLSLKGAGYRWNKDNSKEVEKGWILKADTIRDLAEKIRNTPDNYGRMGTNTLEKTVNRWNKYVQAKNDPEFHRHIPLEREGRGMEMIENPPFYAMECWPVIINTQGGPERNEKYQIVDTCGKPIPRLYSAGELGSFYVHLYQQAGNISECIYGGDAAGRNAAAEKPWS